MYVVARNNQKIHSLYSDSYERDTIVDDRGHINHSMYRIESANIMPMTWLWIMSRSFILLSLNNSGWKTHSAHMVAYL